MSVLVIGAAPRGRMVAITVDDLPYATVGDRPATVSDIVDADAINRAIVAAFVEGHVPVTGFVIQSRVESFGDSAGERMLRRWVQAGLGLGNHSYSHPDFNRLSMAQIEDEIVRGEGDRAKPAFFRFPYNHTGDTRAKHDSIAAVLARRGYRVATCTIQNDDWVFNGAYVRSLDRGDTAAARRVRAAYLAHTEAEIAYFAALDRRVIGYEPPEVMLLHDNRLNADAIGDVLRIFARAGYRFVSLDKAQSDPAYQIPDTVASAFGDMWGYRWAAARQVAVDRKLEPEPPGWVVDYGKN